MNKATIILSLVLLFSIFTDAQNNDFKYSFTKGLLTKNAGNELKTFIGEEKNELFVLRHKNTIWENTNEFRIGKYNKNLKQVASIDFDLERLYGKNCWFKKAVLFDGKLHVYAISIDLKGEFTELLRFDVDIKTMRLNKEPIVVNKFAEPDHSKKDRDDIIVNRALNMVKIALSPDESKMVIMTRESYADEDFSCNTMIFSEGSDEPLSYEFSTDHSSKLFEIDNLTLMNDGKLHIVGCLYDKKSNFRNRNKDCFIFHIFTVSDKGKMLYDTSIEGGEHHINKLKIVPGVENKLICAGFYSDAKASTIAGRFFMTIDSETGEIITNSFEKFDKAINKSIDYKKIEIGFGKGKAKELYGMTYQHLVVTADGGAIMVAEQNYSTYSNQTITNWSNEILIMGINRDGTTGWWKILEKKDSRGATGDMYLSSSMFSNDGILYFVYYIPKEDGQLVSSRKTKYIAIASVNNAGEVTIMKEKELLRENVVLEPGVSYHDIGKSLFLNMSGLRKDMVVRLDID